MSFTEADYTAGGNFKGFYEHDEAFALNPAEAFTVADDANFFGVDHDTSIAGVTGNYFFSSGSRSWWDYESGAWNTYSGNLQGLFAPGVIWMTLRADYVNFSGSGYYATDAEAIATYFTDRDVRPLAGTTYIYFNTTSATIIKFTLNLTITPPLPVPIPPTSSTS